MDRWLTITVSRTGSDFKIHVEEDQVRLFEARGPKSSARDTVENAMGLVLLRLGLLEGQPSPDECPHCGILVQKRTRICPRCGTTASST